MDGSVARRASPPPVQAAQVEAPTPDEGNPGRGGGDRAGFGCAVLGALTGARRRELCALRWPDIDFDNGTLTIARSVYEVAGGGWAEKATKTHQSRTIGLDDLGMELMHRHRSAVEALANDLHLQVLPDGFIFSRSPVGAEPIRPDVVTKFTTRVARRAGVDTHLHALRHFSATQGIAAGYDPVTVGRRLGHADPSITLRVYSHVVEQRDKELAAAVGRTLALQPG